MNYGKNRRQYLEVELQRCEAKLPTLINDIDRYKIASYYVEYLKSCINKNIRDCVDNSVKCHANVVEYINIQR